MAMFAFTHRSPLTHELAEMMPRWAQVLPRLLKEELRSLVEVPHPAMVAKDFELLNRQRAQLSRTNIGVDVAQRTHAGDDRRDGGVRKAIPQSYFGETFDRGTEVFSDCEIAPICRTR